MLDPKEVRRTIVEILWRSQASHLGSAMSAVEMLCAIYSSVDAEKIRRRDPDRARVVVSKGHCAAAHYAVLRHIGLIDADTLMTYCKAGSVLAGLCSHEVPGVEHSTGSLGHGLSVAAGMALALRNRGSDAPVFCLLGDAEIQEGSNWEAWALVRHHRLPVIALIDDNGIGMIGKTNDTPCLPLHFGEGGDADCQAVPGNDVECVASAIRWAVKERCPSIIVCRTVKGKGVPFAENQPVWHYKTLDADTYKQALEALA